MLHMRSYTVKATIMCEIGLSQSWLYYVPFKVPIEFARATAWQIIRYKVIKHMTEKILCA